MADIILFDRKGNEVVHEGLETATFDTPIEGEQAVFTEGVAVEGVEIMPNFAKGDMTVEAEKGILVKSAIIKKPDTLVPENIVADIAIAGIFGTANAFGGKNIVAKTGRYAPETTGETVVEHGLGVIPDVILIQSEDFVTGCILMINGISKELKEIAQIDGQLACNYGTNAAYARYAYCINEQDTTGFGFINSANPHTFKVGGPTFDHNVGSYYTWTAIGCLVEHPGYFYIRLSLDGNKLIITGGVPAIERFKIYANSDLAKTVDYAHGKEFVVDISDISTGFEPLSISVEAEGENLEELYPDQYYETVSNGIVAGGSCGESAMWVLKDDGTMTITGTGAMDDYTVATEQPWYNYTSLIKHVVLENGITHLGSYSFRDVANLTSIELPATLITLGGNCLRNTGLTRIDIPNGVTSIPLSMCYGCSSLIDVKIPDSVTSVGDYAFDYCTALPSIDIPDSVTSIGKNVFYECTALQSINLPVSLTSIRYAAFYKCTKLTSISIPDSVTSIDDFAFQECSGLTSVIIPASVISIGLQAFYKCSKLSSVIISASVKSIGKLAFGECSSLTSATFKDTSGWYVSTSATATSGTNVTVTSSSNAATYLRSTYRNYYWFDKT